MASYECTIKQVAYRWYVQRRRDILDGDAATSASIAGSAFIVPEADSDTSMGFLYMWMDIHGPCQLVSRNAAPTSKHRPVDRLRRFLVHRPYM